MGTQDYRESIYEYFTLEHFKTISKLGAQLWNVFWQILVLIILYITKIIA